MRLVRFFAATILMAAFFTSCSKDKKEIDPPAPAFDIIGVWQGKIGSGSAIPSGSFALDIKAGGKLDRLSDGVVTGTGTWSITGEFFKGEYTGKQNGVVVKVSAKIDKLANKLINGTWKNDSEIDGTWYANKK
ncbi:hypothetical protein LZZ85_26910 [Terrimonas sp. NA20]|uniref:Extracellular endo-alpha-(1->5)-L-arabinanase C-terminal domain-containing protein n=1 Tax=Terrimonas ginsenosidimutans TaxID=2908004 RepID=A0ABS9L018_9BACT|nr:hypothetical protein [Terrimonas ginsenosidimutans]MCG2617962.1 hypothetical protein [Terrimonas ginsenosidimutans]